MKSLVLRSLALGLLTMASPAVLAQTQQTTPAPPPAAVPAPAATPAQTAAPTADLLKAEQLDQLVAPIALYPDALLAEVLMASTYPLEVVQAARWTEQNKSLKGDALKAAVDKQGWDDSVKALAATPSVLKMMNDKLDWTEKLGDAVLAQQPDVMDAVQRLRSRAQANNKLSSTKEQKVTVQQQGAKQVIAIEPAVPDTVYVPYYDPAVVYGSWPYPAYPPYYFGYPGYIPGAVIGAGIAFGAGFALGRWTSGGNYWGGNINWNNNNININRPTVNPLSGGNWQHNPAHRQGVRYNNANVANRYGNNKIGGANNRMDYRGRGGQQVINPGRSGAGTGNRPSAGTRPSTGNRPSGSRPSTGNRPSGSRPSAGTRPSGGSRPSAGTRPASRPSGGGANAFSRPGGGSAGMASSRGRASMGGAGFHGGGGGFRGGGGGGGFRGGGGWLDNGLGYYRFTYNGGSTAYVGVMAQEVQRVTPEAVTLATDGYYRVSYERLGLPFETYSRWLAEGAQLPAGRAATPAAAIANH
jgi:hypothetical protein